jgi:quercetin dioxygenase-like cupin family protein
MPTAHAATASSYNKGDSISVSSGAAHAHGAAAHAIFNYLLSC